VANALKLWPGAEPAAICIMQTEFKTNHDHQIRISDPGPSNLHEDCEVQQNSGKYEIIVSVTNGCLGTCDQVTWKAGNLTQR
jgi:hypothetical protein